MRKFTSPEDLMGVLFEGAPETSIPKAIQWIQSVDNGIYGPLGSGLPSSKKPAIVCVGDVISQGMLSHPILSSCIKYCFIDGETQRGGKIVISASPKFKKIAFKNPRGLITDEIFQFIRTTRSNSDQYIVRIDGEEDLLVVPAVLETNNWFIFYGQPPITDVGESIPAGCVGIYSSPLVKENFQAIFDQLEQISQ